MRQINKYSDVKRKAGLCHRDISFENLLLYGEEVRLIDLGLSRRIPFYVNENGVSSPRKVRTPQDIFYGKLLYAAPELLSSTAGDGVDLFAADVWAVGIIAYVLLRGNLRSFQTQLQCNQSIQDYDRFHRRLRYELFTGNSVGLGFLRRLLNSVPTQRLSVKEALSHDFLKDGEPIKLQYPTLTEEMMMSSS